jgi:hypothetical protein
MAYITVIKTSTKINVDFGVYVGAQTSAGVIPKKRSYPIDGIIFTLTSTGEVDANITATQDSFIVTFDGVNGSLKIDSVDGIAPTSNEDLYNKLI